MIPRVIVYESGNRVKSERIMTEKSVSLDTSVLNQPVNGVSPYAKTIAFWKLHIICHLTRCEVQQIFSGQDFMFQNTGL